MTNENAIKQLKRMKMDKSHTGDEYNAIMTAIKALEAQDEDAISRQAALDAMDALRKEDIETYGCDIPEGFDGERAKQAINALPPVTPKQRTGRLISLEHCSNAGYYCSECHKKVVKEGWSETVKRMNFCPNCGVPLKGIEHR